MSEVETKKYKKTYPEYAIDYGVSDRTVKRWAKKGYPLDDPSLMAEKLGLQKNAPASLQPKSKTALQEEKLREEIEKLRLQNAIAKHEYTANSQIREDLSRIATALRGALMRLENDLPGVLAGLDSSAIQLKIREACDVIILELHDQTSSLYQTIPCLP